MGLKYINTLSQFSFHSNSSRQIYSSGIYSKNSFESSNNIFVACATFSLKLFFKYFSFASLTRISINSYLIKFLSGFSSSKLSLWIALTNRKILSEDIKFSKFPSQMQLAFKKSLNNLWFMLHISLFSLIFYFDFKY
jgi:hypothetical protein